MNYTNILTQVSQGLKPSGIRRFFDLAGEMQDVISLGVGEPDFQTPPKARQAAIRLIEGGDTRYTGNAGMPALRQGVSDYLARRLDLHYDAKTELFITVGGSEAIDLTIRALVEPGDEVLVVEPCFVCYAPLAALAHAKVIPIDTRPENGFILTPEQLRAVITPKTKLLIMSYPSNPTGAVMTKEQLEAIAEVLRGTDIMVLSDEIYAELTYTNQPHVSLSSLPGMRERVILVSGFSKAYAMTGWRLGYVCGPAPVIAQMLKIHQFGLMCAPTISQAAGLVAIQECDDDVVAMREEYDARRQFIYRRLNEIGCTCVEPMGAFYIFPSIRVSGLSSVEFCEKLLYTKKVAVVPGDAFGACGEGHVRISYSYSMEHLRRALEQMEEFLAELKKNA